MSNVTAIELSNLMAARRLLEIEKNAGMRRSGKQVEDKSALEYFEEDQALISGSAAAQKDQRQAPLPPIENININLSGLKSKTKTAEPAVENAAAENFEVTSSQTVEIKLELRYRSAAPLEGLLVHDQHYAESDRYLFKFADGATFTILDKWANKSTTIWGDPHVDVDDIAGSNNGDFKDLKASEDVTSFMLKDGTRVTFKARDDGIIEYVDIFKGSQHVKGIGAAAREFSPENGLFIKKVLEDGMPAFAGKPLGDVVYAGGDGNDWFDAAGKLVWGKTTGPVIAQRPAAVLEFYYRQMTSQSVVIQPIERNI